MASFDHSRFLQVFAPLSCFTRRVISQPHVGLSSGGPCLLISCFAPGWGSESHLQSQKYNKTKRPNRKIRKKKSEPTLRSTSWNVIEMEPWREAFPALAGNTTASEVEFNPVSLTHSRFSSPPSPANLPATLLSTVPIGECRARFALCPLLHFGATIRASSLNPSPLPENLRYTRPLPYFSFRPAAIILSIK